MVLVATMVVVSHTMLVLTRLHVCTERQYLRASTIHSIAMSAPAASSAAAAGVAALPRAVPLTESIELSCPVCLDEYDLGRVLVQRPLVAACGHTVCGQCVVRISAGKDS